MPSNLERMIQLADDFFEVKNDPSQISVDENVMRRLRDIHPASLSEYDNGHGPIAWILVIPTTKNIMDDFIKMKINERELLALTPAGGQYEAVYLCSALVLPEFRRKGLARRLTTQAVNSITSSHHIAHLFYWAFSPEGDELARSVALECGLPLLKRPA